MTVITKPSFSAPKPNEMKSPLVSDVEKQREPRVSISRPRLLRASTYRPSALWIMSLIAAIVVLSGVACGLMLYRQYLHTGTHRYRAYCSIPYEYIQNEPLSEELDSPISDELVPLRWSPTPENVQEYETNLQQQQLVKSLQEAFDIRGRVETIQVYDNGRTVSFIHDFNGNVTGIVDQERCFLMDLDMSLVLSPEALVAGIQREQPFDVSRARSTVRAVLPALLPALRRATGIAECLNKPTYKLDKATGIRKRSTELPRHDYVHFSGLKVHEIQIDNYADVLKSEGKAKAQ